MTLDDGTAVEYKYNGDNLLVERKEGSKKTRYYYDGQVIIAEVIVQADGSTKLKASYFYGNPLLMRENANDQKGYYLTNSQGDVIDIRNHLGNSINQYTYDIWGNVLTVNEIVENSFRYSGEYWDDATNLQYLCARWYDPSVGRFITEDTYEGELNNPLSLNLYTYVKNNPVVCFLRGEFENMGVSNKSA
ncbi:RHS repeat-associated protein [Fontibacillus solani]|uniref:RHS repeat-associated protein n=1 Tax=Fontibacillus solani TaxID=1572857 RepID=A0A7W3SUJ7_9BACL|nr:RHS repeat-associated core domain-containing protein [Fontibacillus solani]MBA9086384.1 RHS repeat-associated protein [Fontibacillus solani]